MSKHKWEILENGDKRCLKCGSRIIKNPVMYKYLERDKWGVMERADWYPRCFPLKDKNDLLMTKDNE